jgi:hypothetical protein
MHTPPETKAKDQGRNFASEEENISRPIAQTLDRKLKLDLL